jgi:hypothetical protein
MSIELTGFHIYTLNKNLLNTNTYKILDKIWNTNNFE